MTGREPTELPPTEDGEPDARSEARWSLGRWQIGRLLGAGGMGEVYQGWDPIREQMVAIKMLRSTRPGRLFRFKQEFRQLADLSHPNLVQLYELNFDDECGATKTPQWFLVMELVDGVHLTTAGASWRREPTNAGLRAGLRQLADAIRALHRANLLHLDLKPANVLVEAGGRVVVLDFGLARHVGATLTSARAGTPRYMAPEQLESGRLSEASDWYAFGVILFELLTGAPAFEGDRAQIVEQQHTVDLRGLLRKLPGLPNDLVRLCVELLDPDPDRRPRGEEISDRFGLARPAPALASLVVGRAKELAALRAALARAVAGPSICWVEGPSGIGKTALVDEFLASLGPEILVLRGRCFEGEAVPYQGFDSLIDDVTRQLLDAGPELHARLEAAKVGECTRLFPVLRHGGVPESSPGPMTPAELRRRGFEALSLLLEILAGRRTLVLFLDDLQWSDVDSARLWLALERRAWPVLMLGSYRSGELATSPFLQEIAIEHGGRLPQTIVSLMPLSGMATAELSATLLPDTDPDWRARLCSESGGNPFLLQALARYCRSDEPAEPSLRRLVDQQLRELGANTAKLMKVVALAGQPIAVDLGLSASGCTTPLATLTALRQANILRSQRNGDVELVESFHSRIRETVVELIEAGERVELHAGLARALEASGAAEPESLGRHFYGAGELAKASMYTEQAADEALRALAFVRAARLYDAALERAPDPSQDRRRQLTLRSAQALFDGGRSIEAGEVFLRASTLAVDNSSALEHRAAEALMLGGDIDGGRRVLASHLAAAGVPAKRHAVVDGLSVVGHLGWLLLRGTRYEGRAPRGSSSALVACDLCWTVARGLSFVQPVDGLLYALRSLRRALVLHDSARIARVLAFVGGGVFHQIPVLRRASRRYISQAMSIAEALDSAELRGSVTVWKGMMELVSGGWEVALNHIETAITLLEGRPGSAWERDVATGLQVWFHQRRGDLTKSGALAGSYHRDAEDRGDVYGQVLFKQYQAVAALADDKLDRARELAGWIHSEWCQGEATVPAYYATWIEVCCDLYGGEVARARSRWQNWRGHFRELGGRYAAPTRIDDTLLEAWLLLNEAPTTSARRRLGQLAAQLAKEERQDCPPHALWLRVMSQSGTDEDRHRPALKEIAEAFERAGLELQALGIELQREPSSSWPEARMRELGVARPRRWAGAFVPAGPWA